MKNPVVHFEVMGKDVEKLQQFYRSLFDWDIRASAEFDNFLEALIERHRMPAIFRIRTEYDVLWDEARKLLPVQITSAIALGEDEVKSLGERIGRQVDRQVQVSADVDPDILGGVVLRVGNVILDASIRNRLEQLRKQVAQA